MRIRYRVGREAPTQPSGCQVGAHTSAPGGLGGGPVAAGVVVVVALWLHLCAVWVLCAPRVGWLVGVVTNAVCASRRWSLWCRIGPCLVGETVVVGEVTLSDRLGPCRRMDVGVRCMVVW